MKLREIIKAIEDWIDASLCVNGETEKKAKQALEALRERDWIPVYDGDREMPETDEDGYSDMILISFANHDGLCIGRYITDESGGAFYEGDEDEEPLARIGLIVNAWKPLPEPYREDA